MFDEMKNKTEAELSVEEDSLFKIYSTEKTTRTHHIYLSEYVESNHGYAPLCHKIRTMGADDVTHIYLTNNGGYCSAGLQLVNAIRASSAKIIMVTDAPCYSMGAILAVSGDALVMNPGSMLMFHNYSSGEQGKGRELIDAVINTERWLRTAFDNVCYPFLSKSELRRLSHDGDVYVHWDDDGTRGTVDLKKRLHRHYPSLYPKIKHVHSHAAIELDMEDLLKLDDPENKKYDDHD